MSRSFDDVISERLNKIHQIRIAKALPSSIANQIYENLTDQIFEHSELISWITKNLGLDDTELIQSAIDQLVSEKKLLQVGKGRKVFYRKYTKL